MRKSIDLAHAAAEQHGRAPADVVATVGLPLFLHDDLEVAYAAARRGLAFYLEFASCFEALAQRASVRRSLTSSVFDSAAPKQENVLVAGQAIAPWISEVAADVFLHPATGDRPSPVRVIAKKKPR
jgi:hypothetical protein